MTISKERFNELLELQESGDDTIDFSDIPELDDDFWANAIYRENPALTERWPDEHASGQGRGRISSL